MDHCIYCHSRNVKSDIEVGQTAEAGAIGLVYQTRFVLCGVEAVYANLCMDCGSIIRFYVKNRDRNWRVKK